MQQVIQKTSENKTPNKATVYTEFILWSAMPYIEKRNLGIETQLQFADYYNVSKDSLSLWKNRSDFEPRRNAILRIWAMDKTPDVVYGIYKAAIKGNPLSQQLWLGYFLGYNPRKEELQKQVELGAGDIRHLIDQLPEQLKEKHYGYLRELTEDVSAVRNARDAEDFSWSQRPAETVPVETDNDAQHVPSGGKNAMAQSHTECVCEDLEREILAHNNQSTTRGW